MSYEDNISLLNSVDFLKALNEEQKRLLAFASERKFFYAGDLIVEKGELSQGAYIINQGVIIVGENEKSKYKIAGPGVMIGELNLLVKRVHHSNVTAQTQLDSLFIPHSVFQKILREYPEIALDIAKNIEENLDEFLQSINEYRKFKD